MYMRIIRTRVGSTQSQHSSMDKRRLRAALDWKWKNLPEFSCLYRFTDSQRLCGAGIYCYCTTIFSKFAFQAFYFSWRKFYGLLKNCSRHVRVESILITRNVQKEQEKRRPCQDKSADLATKLLWMHLFPCVSYPSSRAQLVPAHWFCTYFRVTCFHLYRTISVEKEAAVSHDVTWVNPAIESTTSTYVVTQVALFRARCRSFRKSTS